MFITPYFGGCKYTNNFLFINKNIEFQWLGLLITLPDGRITTDTHSHLVALLLRLLSDSSHSGSRNVSPGRITATTVQYFARLAVQRWRK